MPSRNTPPNRQTIRLPGYNYANNGAYFITLVTWQRAHLFGAVSGSQMILRDWGCVVEQEWRRLPGRFAHVQLGEFVVMPNHLHGILLFDQVHSTQPAQPALGVVIGAFKSSTARMINAMRSTPGAPVWQRNYYERIIRDEKDWAAIHLYILSNPDRWEQDSENDLANGFPIHEGKP